MPPLIIPAIAAGIAFLGVGGGAALYAGGKETGEGLGDGARFALPILAGGTALYLVMKAKK